MEWRPVPPATIALFERLLPAHPEVRRRSMFGCPCAFVRGNMFFGTHQETLLLRLAAADRVAFLALPGAAPFSPVPGRPMREYAVATGALAADPETLGPWVERSLAHALSLPEKTRKPR
jgi:TfoX/Sxy family transcriptional regulator of competence genes